jgi:hypothetical protein
MRESVAPYGAKYSPLGNGPLPSSSKWDILFDYALSASIVLQLLCALAVFTVDPDKETFPILLVLLILLLEALQTALIVFISTQIFRRMRHGFVGARVLVSMYCANLIAFAGLYTLCYSISSDWFSLPESSDSQSALEVIGMFMYYSVSLMTSAGLGDISPRSWVTQLCTSVQMLFATLYYAGIFVAGAHQYRQVLSESRSLHWTSKLGRFPLYAVVLFLLISAIVRHWILAVCACISLVLELLILVDAVLSRKASPSQLARGYLCCVICFATLYRVNSDTMSIPDAVYLSVSCQTLTGVAGAPSSRPIIALQLLLAVFFSASILGLGLAEISLFSATLQGNGNSVLDGLTDAN